MKTIDLPPYAPTLIESTRAIGYSLEAAMADIIDNSIAAKASKVDIFFFPTDKAYISILDNGIGMNPEELNSAMQYGSKNPNDVRDTTDLGRFGLGLKTASLSQCRKLTVVTKQGDVVSGRSWDLDHIAKSESWSLLVLGEDDFSKLPNMEDLLKYESGTLVIWQDLDRLKAGELDFDSVLGKKIDSVRDHLGLVYHRYIAGEKGIKRLKISINNLAVEANDPFLSEKSTRPMDDETLLIRGERILVRAYILPHVSKMSPDEIKKLGGKEGLRSQQGFYVYRNKRLLVWGSWFRMMRKGDLSKLARVQVDIPNTLDDLWTLDIKKSSAIPPAEVRNNLLNVIEKIGEKSRRTWVVRGKREVTDTEVHIWNRLRHANGGYYYEVNREYPVVKQLVNNCPEAEHLLESLLKQIEQGLPLNQLYIDMNNDETVVNEQEQNETDVEKSLRVLLEGSKSEMEKVALLEAMSKIEPFSAYPDVVSRIREEL